MLTELRIDNFAIIEHLALEFKPGLTTFTGETGAGKSIILDAITAVLGGKIDQTALRSGTERAQIEAVFEIPAQNRVEIHELLKKEDLLDDPDLITLGRELRREGRSACRINGRSVSSNLLREIGSYLVDIHGQSEHLSLLHVRQHLGLLDRYAGCETALAGYQQTYQQLQTLRRELSALRQTEQDALRLTDLYNFQLQEIEAARLKAGEETSLRQERDRLANAENLAALAQKSILLLEEGSPETPSLSDMLGEVSQALAALSKIDHTQSHLREHIESIEEQIGDIAHELRGYLEQIEYNPRRLEQVEERLALIHTLTRKYGGSIESVLAYAAEARQKLDNITHASERIAEMEKQESQLLTAIAQQGAELSQLRREAAGKLSEAVEKELADLNMRGARFMVDIRYRDDTQGVWVGDRCVNFDSSGLDQVEFLIAPNPGEGFKPLAKTASGGETSRLMLALKNVLTRADCIPTLIFDEIDQGIGGRVGMVVGQKLWQLARQHQVLCVTHLPQLAAFGDQHLRVQKQVIDGRTTTQVEALGEESRLNELAQMLGGLSEANRSAAHETLQTARAQRDSLL